VLGVATAAQLARAGADVILLTDGNLASETSGRSLAWLNSAGAHSDHYHRFRMAAIDRYRTLSAQHPGLDWLRFGGGLAWMSADQTDELHRRHHDALARGYDSRLLSADLVPAVVPGVSPDAVPLAGAIWNPGEGWADLPSLVRFLADDLLTRGGRLITHAGHCRVLTKAGRVTGVRSERGDDLAVHTAVLATGTAVPAAVAELGLAIPDANAMCLLVSTKPLQHKLTAVLNTPRASVRPTPYGALVVDSDWTATRIDKTADGRYRVLPGTVEELLAEASALLTDNPVLESEWYRIGPKPIPADGEPVLGRIDDVPGLYVAFTHSGATLALLVGELLAYEILQGESHPMLVDFNANRFARANAATP
jgi:glycine/D-amino acid oxidase-like deaminating enzyme